MAVAKMSWLLFLSGVNTGSPNIQLANILPAKMYIMVPIHKEKGCFRENWRAPKNEFSKLAPMRLGFFDILTHKPWFK